MLGKGENRAWCWGGERTLMLGSGEGFDDGEDPIVKSEKLNGIA